jgi:hypothetical protein
MLDIFQVLVYFVIQKLNKIRIYNFLHLLSRVLVQDSFLAGQRSMMVFVPPKDIVIAWKYMQIVLANITAFISL